MNILLCSKLRSLFTPSSQGGFCRIFYTKLSGFCRYSNHSSGFLTESNEPEMDLNEIQLSVSQKTHSCRLHQRGLRVVSGSGDI